jgi:hypothetical protein
MEAGPIVLVFGLLLTGRGLYDRFRPGAVAAFNRRRNARIRTGTLNQPVPFRDITDPRPETAWRVREQGRNVLYFGLATVAVGILLMIFS